jgi:peptidylglycine monooxygenase
MGVPDMTVALGERRYRVERHWGTLPKGMRLGRISKIAASPGGEVYVFQRIDPPVVVFDREGRHLRSWGQGMIADGHGIIVTDDERVLLVDRGGHQVMAFTPEGELLFTIGQRHHPRYQAPFNHPTDVAIAPNGDLYVSDGYGNSMVHWFSPDGGLRRSWGGPGGAPGKFTTPHGIWVLSDGRVLVGDRENNRIQVFTGEGEYLTEWVDHYKPMDIYVDSAGRIHVVDQIPRLTVLKDDGAVIGRCMPVPREGHGISGDAEGNLFIVETAYDYVVRLAPIA